MADDGRTEVPNPEAFGNIRSGVVDYDSLALTQIGRTVAVRFFTDPGDLLNQNRILQPEVEEARLFHLNLRNQVLQLILKFDF